MFEASKGLGDVASYAIKQKALGGTQEFKPGSFAKKHIFPGG